MAISSTPVNVVDLFSGCGGLSLGFGSFLDSAGQRPYRCAMAVDNWGPAIQVFRRNHPAPSGVRLPVGRIADLSWFDHPSEALLYYLVHYAETWGDEDLALRLHELGFGKFLADLKSVDSRFQDALTSTAESIEHRSGIGEVDSKVFSLALCKAVLGKLHLRSLRELKIEEVSLPWVAERCLIDAEAEGNPPVGVDPVHLARASSIWDEAVQQVETASRARGRGQHTGNAGRMASLMLYFGSPAGAILKKHWTNWYAARVAIRSSFCLASFDALKMAYSGSRRVGVLLGGPPCKGFSRIGRAVIRELRNQGAHAWSCNKFGDERNALMYHYVVFIEALRPDVFLFENVSNFASKLKTPDGDLDAPQILEELIESLDCDGLRYQVDARIVKAKQHAVPQARERYIMAGVSSKLEGVAPKHILNLKKQASEVVLSEALNGLPKAHIFRDQGIDSSYVVEISSPPTSGVRPAYAQYLRWVRSASPEGIAELQTDAHIYRMPREDDARLYRLLAPGVRWMDLKTPHAGSLQKLQSVLLEAMSRSRQSEFIERVEDALGIITDSLALRLILEQASVGLDEPHHLLGEGYLNNGSGKHGDWLERLSANKPCKTIVAHIGKDTYGYIHPFEPRPITIREAARIQSFPDWFSFAGVGVVDAYSMIGNAVPPLLSHQFAERVYDALCGGFICDAPCCAVDKQRPLQFSLT